MSKLFAILLLAIASMSLAQASAATATFISPTDITDAELSALSTSGDGAGYILGLNSVFAILLDTPISGGNGDNISIFTAAPSVGSAHATIRFGRYNNGTPQYVASRTIKAGNSVNTSNLFQTGCGVLGGCDYIEIITDRTNKGAPGVEIDYVDVNGDVVQVTSPTPEPDVWLMMIAGFGLTAWRLKKLRYSAKPPTPLRNRLCLLFDNIGATLLRQRQKRAELLI